MADATVPDGRFLEALELALERELALPDDGALERAGRHLLLAPRAKRARPRLVLRLGRVAGADEDALLDVAVAAELLHNASLLHDDVVDEGDERRGRPTANATWGNGVAVLGGDLMITLALFRLRDRPRVITTDGVATVARMARAALAELQARGTIELDAAGWESIARGKTGALLGFCGRAAGHLVGDDALAARLGSVAERLGVAFQMADDIADYGAGTGKARHKDLQERQPNLPLVLACARDERVARAAAACFAQREVTPADAAQLAAAVVDTGALAEASALVRAQAEAAIDGLGELTKTPAGADVLAWARGLAAPDYFTTSKPEERAA
jgi:octaprenyl-diphosphate synthase